MKCISIVYTDVVASNTLRAYCISKCPVTMLYCGRRIASQKSVELEHELAIPIFYSISTQTGSNQSSSTSTPLALVQ